MDEIKRIPMIYKGKNIYPVKISGGSDCEIMRKFLCWNRNHNRVLTDNDIKYVVYHVKGCQHSWIALGEHDTETYEFIASIPE